MIQALEKCGNNNAYRDSGGGLIIIKLYWHQAEG